jgi:hypothetical protein
VRGRAGNDTIRGGRGDDHLRGAAGNDHCRGGTGTDTANTCEIVSRIPDLHTGAFACRNEGRCGRTSRSGEASSTARSANLLKALRCAAAG